MTYMTHVNIQRFRHFLIITNIANRCSQKGQKSEITPLSEMLKDNMVLGEKMRVRTRAEAREVNKSVRAQSEKGKVEK